MGLQPEIAARQVNLADIRTLVKEQKEAIYEAASRSSYGRPMIYLHVSAGHYLHLGSDEAHYTICIGAEPDEIFIPESRINLASPGAHTALRNSGAIGISALCCVGAEFGGSMGDEPLTDLQIETMAQIIAVVSEELDIEISYENVRTHAEQADEDDYGPNTSCERWDLHYLHVGDAPGTGGSVLRGKANWYRSQSV